MTNAIKQRYYVGIDKAGNKRYYVNKVLHREDGPAEEYVNGAKYWYKNGKLHREDGPAINLDNGTKEWYQNGSNNDFTNKSWKIFVKTLIFF